MLRNTVLICGLLAVSAINSTFGFASLRIGNSQHISPDVSPDQPIGPGGEEQFIDNEGSGFPEEENFHLGPLHRNTMSEVLTCPQVKNRVRGTNGETCPRGWSNAPECDQPDDDNFGDVCERKEASEFELPNTVATLRSVLCTRKHMKCLGQAGVIPGDTQLLYAPRNPLSDYSELDETLSNLKQLVALDLGRNDFFRLSIKTFESNKCLRSVNFDLNLLLDIPENLFFHNKALTSVSFAGNKLDYIPPRLFRHNKMLTIVDLSRNNITHLLPGIFRVNRRLEVVRLTGNFIPKIPSGLFSTNYLLREVGLSRNRISAVPKMLFRAATRLQEVRLSANKIRHLSQQIFANCRDLRVVALDRNMITSLPARLFDGNPKLSLIDFSYNRFHIANPKLFVANNPNVTIVNKQWGDRQGVLEEENEEGDWYPAQGYPLPYRKSAFTPNWPVNFRSPVTFKR